MTWLKDLINEPGRPVPPIGTFMKIPAVETVEIVKLAGFDFIVLDAEHALLSLADLNRMILVARAVGIAPVVRVPDHGYGDAQRILDAGAAGLFFPHVSDRAQCEQVIRQASHPPYGTRGAGGGMRAGNWGMAGRASAGLSSANYVRDGIDKVMRIPMIEERTAVDNADEILSVEGVDGVFIGPGDLSMTMGMKATDPEVRSAIEEVLKKAKAAQVPVGTVSSDAAGARRLVEKGYDFILVSNDTGMLAKTAMALIDEIKALSRNRPGGKEAMATPKITGAEYLARALDAYGVTATFFVPTILSRTLYELEARTGIRRILTHGEKASVYMADGYARASGRPGICMAQTVGAANLAAGLRDPFLGCSPVLALTGGPYHWSRGRNYYQEIEDFPLFKPVTKFSAQVTDAGRLPDLLAYAFAAATAGKPGPVHLEVAGHSGEDVENGETDAAVPASGPVQVPRLRTRPTAESVAAAARLLRAASRPVIVAGGGVRASGAGGELRALAERLNVPVATSLNAKDVLPGDHPLNVGVPGLYSRASANHVLLEADLVFFVGSKTGNQVTLKWQVPPLPVKVIHLDIDPAEIGRHYPDTLGLVADAKLGLAELADALAADPGDHAAWTLRAQDLVRSWRREWHEPMTADQVPIRPERLCAELTAHLPGNALLVSDTGHSGMWTGGMIDLCRPGQGYIRAAGSLGWGLPAALGAQVAQPGRPVVLFTGDGGLWYHIAELETAARCQIPAVIVVNNNSSLNQEINPYTAAYGGSLHGRHGELWHFRETDFAQVAESMGALGLTVRKARDFEGALDKALASGRPAAINVVTEMEALAPAGVTQPAPPAGQAEEQG